MHQILLVEPNDKMRDILLINLTNYLGSTVTCKKNSDEALELLKILPSVALVITRNQVEKDDIAKKIFQYKQDNNQLFSMMILGNIKDKDLSINCIQITNPSDWKNVIRIAGKTLGISAELMAKVPVPNYFPMNAKYLLILPKAPCDIYIRIKKEGGEYQYVKRFHENDAFKKEDIERYLGQGLTEFYVSKDLRLSVTNMITDQLILMLKKDLTPEDRVSTTGIAFEIANRELLETGFTPMTTQLVEGIVNSMAQTITQVTKKSQLVNLLQILLSNTGSFNYRHAHMISVIASTIVKNSEWGNEEQIKKVAFVAFFHDISLDKDELVKINSEAELNASTLSAVAKSKVLSHAAEASRLVVTYPDLPMGADVIVRQHHGVPNGVGFATHVPPSISPLAAVFICAEEFVVELLKTQELDQKAFPKKVLETIKERLSGAAVKRAFITLENSFKKD